MEINKKFNKRAFISVGLFASGISLPLSGLMNHFMDLDPMTTTRHFWMAMHWASGLLFTTFAFIHIRLNWLSIKNHLLNFKRAIISKEAIAAISIVIFITALIVSHSFHVR